MWRTGNNIRAQQVPSPILERPQLHARICPPCMGCVLVLSDCRSSASTTQNYLMTRRFQVFPGWPGDTALDDKDAAFWTAHHCITAPVQTPEQVAEECQRLRTEHEIAEGGQWGSADEKSKAYWSFHECADVLAALGRCMKSCEKPCAEQEVQISHPILPILCD